MSFIPKFEIPHLLIRVLMDIEASRQAVSDLPITVQVLDSLRESARLTATHYSTQIEGNRLTQLQVGEVLRGGTFPNRERDEQEIKNYYRALDHVEHLIGAGGSRILEKEVKTIHGLVVDGRKRPTPYRDGQNVIKDSASGAIVYMPPEAKDVPSLMSDLIAWINVQNDAAELPVPIIGAIAHYQFATIHPYFDGNGRTARLLTNLVLHRGGYGLKGIYSLEEYYARDLQGYYDALAVGESHNYYFGRIEADITKWIVYFCEGMADAFATVRLQASESARQSRGGQNRNEQSRGRATIDYTPLLRDLDQRQKQVLSLFRESRFVTTRQIADMLGLHPRTALNLCKSWVKEGFLVQHGVANKSRKFELESKWLVLFGGNEEDWLPE